MFVKDFEAISLLLQAMSTLTHGQQDCAQRPVPYRQPDGQHPWRVAEAGASSRAANKQWAALLSVLAGMHSGRAYLCSAASAVVQQLCFWMQTEDDSSPSNVSLDLMPAAECTSLATVAW